MYIIDLKTINDRQICGEFLEAPGKMQEGIKLPPIQRYKSNRENDSISLTISCVFAKETFNSRIPYTASFPKLTPHLESILRTVGVFQRLRDLIYFWSVTLENLTNEKLSK